MNVFNYYLHNFTLSLYVCPDNKVKSNLVMAFGIDFILFPDFYYHAFVSEKSGDLDHFIVTEIYVLQSISYFQLFQIVIVVTDIAVCKSGIQRCLMYILRNFLVRFKRLFCWSSDLFLFGQIALYQFGYGFFVYAESERLKLTVTDMEGFDHAYSLVLFIHFDLHDGFRFVVEFRADVTTGMFIILVLMQDGMNMDLPVIRPLHEFGDDVGGFTGGVDVVKEITNAIYDDQSQIWYFANSLFDYRHT